jgi:hypothetical protein
MLAMFFDQDKLPLLPGYPNNQLLVLRHWFLLGTCQQHLLALPLSLRLMLALNHRLR